MNEPYNRYYEQAKAASEAGKLKLVKEMTLEPYNGKGFELKKGQQEDLTSIESFTCYRVRIAIYEGEDIRLETAPDPQRQSMNAVDFNLAGRPGMVTSKVGTNG